PLARLSLANRSLVLLISLALGVLGAFAIPSLKQQLFPSLELPAAFAVAGYPGAAPEIVEEQVTEPLESAFKGISGVTEITSTSKEGLAQIQVAFDYGTDIDDAVASMQQAVNRIKAQLPSGVDPQIIAGSTDDIPVLVIAVAEAGDQQAMLGKIERIMVPKLRAIEGVRDVSVTGARERQVVITPHLMKMAMLGQTGERIRTVDGLKTLCLMPGAQSAGSTGATAGGDAARAAAAKARAVKPVKLGDVATIEVKEAPATSFTRTNGQPTLGVAITMRPDGNAVQISHEVRELLPGLTRDLGDAAELTIVFDQAPYVEHSIKDLTTEGLLGLVFAVVVILVFLLSVRSTLV